MQETFWTTLTGMVAITVMIALLHLLTGDLALAARMTGSATMFVLGSYLVGLLLKRAATGRRS